MKITYLGHAGFMLQENSSILLIDPGKKESVDISGDIVFVTHSHFDHTRGVELFLKRNPEAVFICNQQVADRFEKWRERIVIADPGEKMQQGIWNLRFIKGRHGLFSKEQNTGVIIKTQSLSFGHAGDSVDFQGFSREKIDILAVPICGLFAASPKRALKELEAFSQPLPIVIPMHWLLRSPSGFCKKLKTKFPNSQCIVPKDGEIINF